MNDAKLKAAIESSGVAGAVVAVGNSKGTATNSRIIAISPNGRSLAYCAASGRGKTPSTTWLPSNGGNGSMLNTASITLIRTKLRKLSHRKADAPVPVGGTSPTSIAITTIVASAITMLMPGPASDTSTMCQRGSRIFEGLTGTAFAQPKIGAPATASIIGSATVPIGSTCLTGLSVSRPIRAAV